jgi:hypothetical protein
MFAQGKPGENKEPLSAAPRSEKKPSDPFIEFAARWDTNGDSTYTCDEWKIFATTLFRRADKNHDGFITEDEFPVIRGADRILSNASLSYFDTNSDKKISRAEFIEKPNPLFIIYDANKDCKVTPQELQRQVSSSPDEARKSNDRHK